MLDDVVAEAGADGVAGPRRARARRRPRAARRPARGRPTRANFRTGHLTVCTLVPMRSVPHRVVCLLGLDDGEFPRRAPRDGDDLMLQTRTSATATRAAEDRQMLLDALLAANERLVVIYTGQRRAHERSAARRPFRSASCSTSSTARSAPTDGPARDQVVSAIRCSRSTRATSPAASSCHGPWGFDRSALAGARALRGARRAGAFLPAPLPAHRRTASSSSTGLIAFFERPVRAFLRRDRSGSTSASRSTKSTTRCRSSSTGSRRGQSVSGCSTACSAGSRAERLHPGGDRPRAAPARRARRSPARPADQPTSSSSLPRAPGRISDGDAGLARRQRRAARRTDACRDRHRRVRGDAAAPCPTRACARASVSRHGSAARAHRQPARAALRGGHRRPAPSGHLERRRDRGADPAARTRTRPPGARPRWHSSPWFCRPV